jgi:hypothetical protein
MTFDTLAKAFETRSPIDIDGEPFTFSLTSLREPLPHQNAGHRRRLHRGQRERRTP